jgi:hypothetical protein
MGKSSPSAPPAPDPRATAQAQAEFNLDAARQNADLNRINQFTPQGSLTYTKGTSAPWDEAAYLAANPDVAAAVAQQKADPGGYQLQYKSGQEHYLRAGQKEGRSGAPEGYGTDRWTQTTTLSPEQQRLYDLSTQGQEIYGNAALSQLRQAQTALSSPFEFNAPDFKYGADFTGIGDPNQSRDAVEQALLARLNPDLERERASLESRLANQGITQGSEAWRAGIDDYTRQANDARYGAILNAGAEQSRIFGLGFGQSQFNNAARQQSLEQQLALRAQPINEASALLTGGQVQQPQFSNFAQVGVQAPDYAGAAGQQYAGQVGAANTAAQRAAQTNGQTAGAASAAAAAAASIAAAAIVA